MKELKQRIHENGIDYVLAGDYYIPAVKPPEEERPSGNGGVCTGRIWRTPTLSCSTTSF